MNSTFMLFHIPVAKLISLCFLRPIGGGCKKCPAHHQARTWRSFNATRGHVACLNWFDLACLAIQVEDVYTLLYTHTYLYTVLYPLFSIQYPIYYNIIWSLASDPSCLQDIQSGQLSWTKARGCRTRVPGSLAVCITARGDVFTKLLVWSGEIGRDGDSDQGASRSQINNYLKLRRALLLTHIYVKIFMYIINMCLYTYMIIKAGVTSSRLKVARLSCKTPNRSIAWLWSSRSRSFLVKCWRLSCPREIYGDIPWYSWNFLDLSEAECWMIWMKAGAIYS